MSKKKRSKKFNISNRLAYTLIIILSIVLLGMGVYAYNMPPPTNVGHTINEIAQPSGCLANQVLTWTGSAWTCTTPAAGTKIPVYQCPMSIVATNYCANVQLTRNGVPPCIGQLTINSGTACFIVDANCAYVTTSGCTTLVGYLTS